MTTPIHAPATRRIRRMLPMMCAALVASALAGCGKPGEVPGPPGSTAPAPVPSPLPTTPTDSTPTVPLPPASAASQ